MARVLIDGYNLGLEKGTGVATYARNLSYEIAGLGHEVDVLYGNNASATHTTWPTPSQPSPPLCH